MGDDIDLDCDCDLGDVCFCDDDCDCNCCCCCYDDCNCCCYDSNSADNSCSNWNICLICISWDNNQNSHRERHYHEHDPCWWCCCCRDDNNNSRKMKELRRKESDAKKEQVGIDDAKSERCYYCGKNKTTPDSRCSNCLRYSKVSSALDPHEIPQPQTMAPPQVAQLVLPLHNEKYFMYRDRKDWYHD
ncbi:uncharacterized protein LOC120011284 [Tripterygium wilfordii]|uniref:uncharacterized protein LOC120011284 n=1 Tax=Tripterygium wilfordii TaxID=458696 RepID=UPI0018F860A1|nr:uncharacterized protein LOC120011284 [Tripterygium wilfordii]